MAGFKEYVLEFRLADGTMHSIPFRVPLGEDGKDGGYYTPVTREVSDRDVEITFVPSEPGMPVIAPFIIKGGEPGKDGTVSFDELTEAQRESLRGDPFTYDDFTAEQLAALKGEPGYTPQKGIDYFDGKDGRTPRIELLNVVEEDNFGNVQNGVSIKATNINDDGTESVMLATVWDGNNGAPGDDYVLTPADKTEIAEMAAELVDVPESSGGGIAVTGAKVGQTVQIAAVDENGVPTEWLPADFPSGGGGGSNAFKLLASVEPITEPVQKISVAIEEDGISEIYLVGKVKQAEDNSYNYAHIGVNNNSVSFNFGIETDVEYFVTYHGVILEGGHWLMTMRTDQYWRQDADYILTAPQGGFDNLPEEVNEVYLAHSGSGMLAIGTYFDVWGR